jgi:hypothetical protein
LRKLEEQQEIATLLAKPSTMTIVVFVTKTTHQFLNG